MSQANVELVRRAYDAWARRDLDAFLELLASDFEFQPFAGWGDLQKVYRGSEVAQLLRNLGRSLGER